MAQKAARSKTNVAVEINADTKKKLRSAKSAMAHTANAWVLASNEGTRRRPRA